MIPRLGVNIDHVATLRQARGEAYPSVERAAKDTLLAGADQITIHLREDRRHIQDADVPVVHSQCREFKKPLNLEIGCHPAIIDIAIKENPEWICLVPEKREERTTEGGLDLITPGAFARVFEACEKLKKHLPKTKISLFVEADQATLNACLKINSDAVEIHTGEYAKDFIKDTDLSHHLKEYLEGFELIQKSGRGYHAGHGLTFESVAPLLEQGVFSEYNIGHWMMGEALSVGLSQVTRDMLELFKKYPLKVK